MRENGSFLIPAGVFLLSMGMLAYEVALSRVFSVILSYHYVFLILSAAMLGLSFGGVFEFFWSRRGRVSNTETPLTAWAFLAALSLTGSIFLINTDAASSRPLLLAVIAMGPFVFVGVTLAATFRRFAERSSFIYGADLVGGALGAVLVVGLLNVMGGPDSILFSGVLASFAALFLTAETRFARSGVLLALSALVLTGLPFALSLRYPLTGEVPVAADPNKDMSRLLRNPSLRGEIVESRWSAFGRSDLVRFNGDTLSMSLFVDGAAGTPMYRWDGDGSGPAGTISELMASFSGAIPLLLLEDDSKDSALIIGPGGGRDVLVALGAGFREITAVEINPEFVGLVKDYADYNGGLFTSQENVRVVIDEGRNFLKRSEDQYDLVMLSLPVTKSSRSYEGYALSENYLFTKESLQEYLAHLTPEGILVVVGHGFDEMLRLLTTALAALEAEGIPTVDAMGRVYILGEPMMPVFVLGKTALDQDRARSVHGALHLVGFEGMTSYVPYAEQASRDLGVSQAVDGSWVMMNQNLIDLAEGKIRPEQLVRALAIDIGPVSDDRPFFFDFSAGVPASVTVLLWVAGLMLVTVIAIPWLAKNWRQPNGPGPPRTGMVLVFTGLGIGFMLVEITLFQKLVLYLGHPTFALSLLLFSLLAGTGLGGLASGVISSRRIQAVIAAASAAAGVTVWALAATLTPLFEQLADHQRIVTTVAAAGLLGGLGILMGVPFPLAIRHMGDADLREDVPWMWGVNGAASVLGSVLAVAIATSTGFDAALRAGGLVYVAVGLSGLILKSRGPTDGQAARGARKREEGNEPSGQGHSTLNRRLQLGPYVEGPGVWQGRGLE